jgi:hypothetical protein
MNRRRFIPSALAVSGASLLKIPGVRAAGGDVAPKSILVLGGTSFLGPALVEAAVVGGHSVTLFNRGITNPELFPFLEKLRGLHQDGRSLFRETEREHALLAERTGRPVGRASRPDERATAAGSVCGPFAGARAAGPPARRRRSPCAHCSPAPRTRGRCAAGGPSAIQAGSASGFRAHGCTSKDGGARSKVSANRCEIRVKIARETEDN